MSNEDELSAEVFYSEIYTDGREDPLDTFKFAEAYAAHVSQGYERRIQELERGLSLYKRAHEHLMEVMGLEKDELQVPRAAQKWQEAERQLAEARQDIKDLREDTKAHAVERARNADKWSREGY